MRLVDARFEQSGNGQDPLIIHESVTAPRATVLKTLSELKSQNKVGSYHTRNGQIRARKSVEYQYVMIPPGSSPEKITELVGDAGTKTRGWGTGGGAGQGPRGSRNTSHHNTSAASAHRGPGPMGADAPASWPTPSEAKKMSVPPKDAPALALAGGARNESDLDERNNSNVEVSDGHTQPIGTRVLRSGSVRKTDSAKKV